MSERRCRRYASTVNPGLWDETQGGLRVEETLNQR